MTNSEDANGSSPKKVWRTGTLTYTTGGLVLLGLWLFWGDFPLAMKDRTVFPSATILLKQLSVSDFLFGLILVSFPHLTHLILNPLVSYISDRHRGRWGRRIPFLLWTTPFIVVGLVLIGMTHPLGELLHAWWPDLSRESAKLAIFCIGWGVQDLGAILSGSLFGALVNDVVPRELIGRFFSLFRMVSLGAGMTYNLLLIDRVKEYTLEIFVGTGLLYGAGLLVMCWKVKEGDYPPVEEAASAAEGCNNGVRTVAGNVFRSFFQYFRQSFSLSYYRWYMVAVAIAGLAFTPINFFSIQYAQSLGIGMDQYGIYLVITYCCSLAISFGLGALSDRFHPIRTGFTALFLYALLMFAGYIFFYDTGYFGVMFILHGILSGGYMTLTASLGPKLLPRSLYAQFISACGMVTSLIVMVFGPLLGLVLDLLHQEYRILFLIAGVLAAVSVLLFLKVFRNFQKHGGDMSYEAPMPSIH